MKRDQTTGHLASLFIIIIWGTAFISTKILLVDFRPVEILFFRFVMGLIPLLLVYPLLRLGRIGSALSPGILRPKCWARSRQAFISIWSP